MKSQAGLEPNLQEVGLTRDDGAPNAGYNIDEVSQVLGSGEAMFEQLVRDMKVWKHFDIWWLSLYPEKPVLEVGTPLVVAANHGPIWSLNACKIVYVIDDEILDSKPRRRFGYGYATLAGHSEQGEERFLLEWDQTTDRVTYLINAFSRSNDPLVSLLYPVARFFQCKFRSDSIKALRGHLVSEIG